jgi:hypothetical protein
MGKVMMEKSHSTRGDSNSFMLQQHKSGPNSSILPIIQAELMKEPLDITVKRLIFANAPKRTQVELLDIITEEPMLSTSWRR